MAGKHLDSTTADPANVNTQRHAQCAQELEECRADRKRMEQSAASSLAKHTSVSHELSACQLRNELNSEAAGA